MYRATQNLSNENVTRDVKVHFVVYHVDRSMPIPFLRFYLVRDCEPIQDTISEVDDAYIQENEYLTFPSIDYNADKHFLFTLYCQGVVESLFHDDREYVQSIQHQGHLLDLDSETENNDGTISAYAFFELTPTTTEAEHMTRETFICPVLMDEILHKNRFVNTPIHSIVTTFFVTHPSFIYLQDFGFTNQEPEPEPTTNLVDNAPNPAEEHLIYDMPIVVYHPVPGKVQRTQFTAMFGVTRADGVFKFYSYERAMSLLRENPNGTHGLVRLALYAGNTTIDKEEFETSDEIQTFYHGYEYHAKEYNQQKPLSYHRIPIRHSPSTSATQSALPPEFDLEEI